MPEITDRLRTVLLDAGQAQTLDVRGAVRAAVLVPLTFRADGSLALIFTKRRNDMRRHAGEISFPGGRQERGDADLLGTAMRETEEEIGLPGSAVEVLGALQPTPTIVTGFAVYPLVALVSVPVRWSPNTDEVAQVLELGIDELAAGYGRRRLVRRGVPMRTDTYLVDGNIIWGATARILADLLDRLALLSR